MDKKLKKKSLCKWGKDDAKNNWDELYDPVGQVKVCLWEMSSVLQVERHIVQTGKAFSSEWLTVVQHFMIRRLFRQTFCRCIHIHLRSL